MKKFLCYFALALLSTAAFAQAIPKSAAVEFTVMHSAGGTSDLTSRFIANNLNKNYVVVNRPGGSGRIAINHLFKENTMLLATMTHVFVTNPINFQDLGHDPKKDFEVMAIVGVLPSMLVCNKKTGFKTFKDFLKTDKHVSFGFGGFGSYEHIATELLVKKTNIKSTMVSYAQGGSKSVADLIGGHIDCMFSNYPAIKSHLVNENLTLLMTSHHLGYNSLTWNSFYKTDFPFQSYLSIIVPTAMNQTIKNQILNDLKNSFDKVDYAQGLQKIGIFPMIITDKQKIKNIVEYMDTIRKFILENNILTRR